MTRSCSAGRRSEWSRMEKTAYSHSVSEGEWLRPLTAVVAYLGLDGDVQRGSRWLSTKRSWAERARKMQEGIGGGHLNDSNLGQGEVPWSRGAWGLARDVDVWWGTMILFTKSGQVRFACTDHQDLFSGRPRPFFGRIRVESSRIATQRISSAHCLAHWCISIAVAVLRIHFRRHILPL